MKSKKIPEEKLIPPDPKQCQYMIYTGAWPVAKLFMSFGPREVQQCTQVPVVIVTERKPPKGSKQCGSMSLCKAHWKEFIEAYGPDYAIVELICTDDV